ncbi:MAG: phage/plasmid primase, P4 family [Rubrimonas sp.]
MTSAIIAAIDRALGGDDAARRLREATARLDLEECDDDNAERLRRAFGEDMLFVTGLGWGVWTGALFDFDNGRHLARRMGMLLRELVKAEAEAAGKRDIDQLTLERAARLEVKKGAAKARFVDPEGALRVLRAEDRVRLLKHATKCGNRDKINAALELLEAKQLAPRDSLDADPWRLAAPNGVLDLRAVCAEPPEAEMEEERLERRRGWLSPPDRGMRNTRTLGVPFDPAAECPAFLRHLELITGTQGEDGTVRPRPEMMGFVLRCLGLLVFGRNFLQLALLLRGGGGNGKSTLINVIRFVLGLYAAPCKIEMVLAGDKQSAGQATPEEVSLPGARAMIMSEPDISDVLSAKKIKSLTGGDPRPARALNMPQFIYTPTAVPVISFNRTPEVRGEDEGTWRRLIFIPFDVDLRRLPEAMRRGPDDVEAELMAEGSGILNLLLDAFASVRAIGLAPPPAAQAMKTELRSASDPVGEFMRACTERAEGARVQAKELFAAYAAWCEQAGAKAFTPHTVGKLLIEKGYRKTVSGGRTYYVDLSLTADAPLLDG